MEKPKSVQELAAAYAVPVADLSHPIVLQRDGQAFAVLISIEEYERYRALMQEHGSISALEARRAADRKIPLPAKESYMLDRSKLGSRVIGLFVVVAVLVATVGGLGYHYAALGQASSVIIEVTLIAVIVTVICGVLLARSMTASLALIVRMSLEMGRGHFGMRLRMNRQDEIGVMADALNRLAEDLQKNVVVLMKKVAAGDLNVTVEPRDSQDEIALAMKKTVELLRGLVTETDGLSRSAEEGKLTVRANTDRFPGAYRTIIQQVNHALESATKPIQLVAWHAARLAVGDTPQIAELGQGDWNEIQRSLNVCSETIQSLTADSIIISQAAAEGRLSPRANAIKYPGNYYTITQNLNSILEDMAAPLNKSAECLASLAAGDVPPPIVNSFKGDYEALRHNLNQIIETARQRETDSQLLLEAATAMQWSTRADTGKYSGANGRLVDTMNRVMDALTRPSSTVAEHISLLAQGNIPPKINETYQGDLEELRNNVNACIDAVQALGADTSVLSRAAAEGRLTIRADTTRHQGEFRKVVQNSNSILDAVADPLRLAIVHAGRMASGDIPQGITQSFPGDWAELKNNLNACADAIQAFIADMNSLSKAMTVGNLTVRANASKHHGRFRDVIENTNLAMDAVMMPVSDATRMMTQLAQGDLTAETGAHYPGDWVSLKTSLDAMADGLKATAFKTQQASFGMSAATTRLLASSNQMAGAAQQQANAVIQITSTVQETKSSAEQSVQQAQEMARVISELASVVEASAQAAQQVVTGVEHDTAKLDQIATDMGQINQTVQYALETAQQWQEMAQNLMALSEQLKLTAAHYRL